MVINLVDKTAPYAIIGIKEIQMAEGKHITDPTDIARFVHGGNALFTLVSSKTGTRFTYRARKSKDGSVFFVSVMFGRDNISDYAYMGVIRDNRYQPGRKSNITPGDVRNKAFAWFYQALQHPNNSGLDKIEFWHEGRCACCGRTLTVPESIEKGIGPECAKRHF